MGEDTRIPVEGMVSLPRGFRWCGVVLCCLLHPGSFVFIPLETGGLEQLLLVEQSLSNSHDDTLTVFKGDAGNLGHGRWLGAFLRRLRGFLLWAGLVFGGIFLIDVFQQALVGIGADGQKRHAFLDGIGNRAFLGIADIAFDDLHLAFLRSLAEPFTVHLEKEFHLGDRLAVEDLLLAQFVPPIFRAKKFVDAVKDVLGPIAVLYLAYGLSFLAGHFDFLDRFDPERA